MPGSGLDVPARAEIVLEGVIMPGDDADEGPFGDHTGYYNETERYPVLTVQRLTRRRDAIYHSTYTGRPPDEPAMLGAALNELFVPLLRRQFPEVVDFYLPPEGCSYRVALVSIRKQYPGHASRVMFGVWSTLRQFLYTKFIVVVDDDIDVRSWQDVVWAISTRVDPARDLLLAERTPIDTLDFASPAAGPGLQDGPGCHQQVARRDRRASGAGRFGWTPRSRRGWTACGRSWGCDAGPANSRATTGEPGRVCGRGPARRWPMRIIRRFLPLTLRCIVCLYSPLPRKTL